MLPKLSSLRAGKFIFQAKPLESLVKLAEKNDILL
jgi:hypothetical protein